MQATLAQLKDIATAENTAAEASLSFSLAQEVRLYLVIFCYEAL
jgi:hypothetical protein